MTIGLLFWVLYVVSVVFGVWSYRSGEPPAGIRPLGGALILWVLIFLLGWGTFGFVVKG